jgi:CrcB protein
MSSSPPSPDAATPSPNAIGLALEAALVGAGGAVGALARGAIAGAVPILGGSGFAATQLVNLVGALALGMLVGRIEVLGPSPRWRAFLGIGVLGSFTTFSAWIADGRDVSRQTSPGVAAALLAGSLALGLAAYALGHRIGAGVGAADDGRSAAATESP